MRIASRIAPVLVLAFSAGSVDAGLPADLATGDWPARWVTEASCNAIPCSGVFLFRKAFDLTRVPDRFPVRVSADEHYRLFVNGHALGHGPVRGMPERWFYDTYDLAPHLVVGRNVLAAEVENAGEHRAWGQVSGGMALIVQGETPDASAVNTDGTWRVRLDPGLRFVAPDREFFPELTGVGPSEDVDAKGRIWDFAEQRYDDSHWTLARPLGAGTPRGHTPAGGRALSARMIPTLEEKPETAGRIVRVSGLEAVATPLTVPPRSRAAVLFDRGELTTAYPVLSVAGGRGSRVRLVYNEAMQDGSGNKGERGRFEGLVLRGLYDVFRPDGEARTYRSLRFRTYRFLELDIETAEEPLQIRSLEAVFTAYPFVRRASFKSSDPELERIFDAGWRTARLSAHDNYFDCPFYEQLQYFGDLAVSNPITVLLSGDARLMRQAILQADDSRRLTPLTTCASPGKDVGKIIPFFSLAWIDMTATYLTLTGDRETVSSVAEGLGAVLDWYEKRLGPGDLLGPMPYWNFVDCTNEWPWAPERGVICEPPGAVEGGSVVLTLQHLYGLTRAREVFATLGDDDRVARIDALARRLTKSVRRDAWDPSRGLVADTKDKASFSQHANIFAALTGVMGPELSLRILDGIEKDPSLVAASLQYQAYHHRALVAHGRGESYVSRLGPWRQLLSWGFSTFPEYPRLTTRSDCHPWSAYPAYELLTVVCGIRPAAPAFRKVTIEPHLGPLSWVEGSLPHPGGGEMRVALRRTTKGLEGEVSLPPGVTGTFLAGGKSIPLTGGTQRIQTKGR